MDAGRLWLIGSSPMLSVIPRSAPSSSPVNRSSTPLDIRSRSSIHVFLVVILDVSVRACVSSDMSASAESLVSTLFRLDWVDIDDCINTLDISKACTLRASNESRYGSFEGFCLLLREEPCERRVLRGEKLRGAGGGLYSMAASSSVSVSASASSALLG